MSSVSRSRAIEPISHSGEAESDSTRAKIAALEARSLRTYTPSLAVIARSEGCYHYTPEGRKLADFSSGVLVANLGHNPTRWWQSVLRYLGHGEAASAGEFFSAAPLTAYNAITTLEAMACERLIANLQSQPGGRRLEQVMWSASGSEGIIKAIRAALAQDPRRQKILATRRGFHGKKGLAGAVTGGEQDPDRDPRVRFISFPTSECDSLEKRRKPLGLAPYEAELARVAEELNGEGCCLVTEPYLGGGGSFHPQREYLQLLQSFCREHEIAFILDEVQSNFGRTGAMYAFTTYGVEPDIVVLGKGMGNGIPVNGVVGRADLFEKLDYGESSDTWSGHPLGCAALLATLDEFENRDVLENAQTLAQTLETGLSRLAETRAVSAIRGEGTVWGIQCAAIGDRDSAVVAREFVKACYLGDGEGLAIHLLGPLNRDVIRVAPPLVMPPAEAEFYLAAMLRIAESVSRG